MNRIKTILSILIPLSLAVSCKTAPKDVTLDMFDAPAGNFTMGLSSDNRRMVTRGIAQPVALDGFKICKEPVTQAQWESVMGNNPSSVKDPSAPVDMVSWADIQKFVKKLSKSSGMPYSLPTEAQWEYAQKLCKDKGFTAVAEWCLDSYDEVPEDATKDDYFVPMSLMVNPSGPKEISTKVVRTTLERMGVEAHIRRTHVGFRLTLPSEDKLTEDIMQPLEGLSPEREKTDASGGGYESFEIEGVKFKMVKVRGGSFVMGFNASDSPYLRFTVPENERNAHQVSLEDFQIGETEVTVGLWAAVMGSLPYLNDAASPEKPVGNVSWYDCQIFLRKLNKLTGRKFRLPTEAEWEFAARGGTSSRHYVFSGGNDMNPVMWFLDNADSKPHDVKKKSANELGLYDMSGNVWEWCHDRASEYTLEPAFNPVGPAEGGTRILRGGSCASRWDACRISNRSYMPAKNVKGTFGLRLAL